VRARTDRFAYPNRRVRALRGGVGDSLLGAGACSGWSRLVVGRPRLCVGRRIG